MRRAGPLVVVLVGLLAPLAGSATEGEFGDLAARCAPSVHPQTLAAIVRHESGFNPLAIGVNGEPKLRPRPKTTEDAVRVATALIGQGRSIDMGLGQINSANLARLGLSVRDVFDPCTNLRAAATILTENYLRVRPEAPSEQAALDAALSLYNTGSTRRGLRNGYVAKVRGRAAASPPTIEEPAIAPAPAAPWDTFALADTRRTEWDAFAARAKSSNGGSSSWSGQ